MITPTDIAFDRMLELIQHAVIELKVDPKALVERLCLHYGVTDPKPPLDLVEWAAQTDKRYDLPSSKGLRSRWR